MSDNNSSSTATTVVVALVALGVGFFIGKSSGTGNQQAKYSEPKPEVNPKKPVPAEPKEPEFIKQGLVAYYPFDGNAKDASGNGNDGKVAGAVLSGDRHGKANSSYAFARGPIELPKELAEKFGGEKAISFSGWVKCSPNQAAKSNRVIFNTGESSSNRSFSVFMEKGNLAFSQYLDRALNSNKTLSDDQWHHCAATYGDGKLSLFVDGKLAVTKEIRSNRSSRQMLIGARFGGSAEKWPGSIDDVRIYDRALSASQVKALYEWEQSKEVQRAGPPLQGAVNWKGHWYALLDDKKYTITEARKQAKALGSHLPYLDSKEEEEFVIRMAKGANVFLGLVLSKDGWAWGDGARLDYVNWGPGNQGARHPNETYGENGDFVIIRDKAWADINKADAGQFRCPIILEWKE